MDPRNREIVSQLIVSSVKDQQDIQYIVITPGQIAILDQDTHIITVQNVQGRSEVRAVV
jgi:chromosome segregation ATPase